MRHQRKRRHLAAHSKAWHDAQMSLGHFNGTDYIPWSMLRYATAINMQQWDEVLELGTYDPYYRELILRAIQETYYK